MVTDAIIFDFDDTLVATNVIFEDIRQEFFAQWQSLVLPNRQLLPSI